jgi:hypothetical protein
MYKNLEIETTLGPYTNSTEIGGIEHQYGESSPSGRARA